MCINNNLSTSVSARALAQQFSDSCILQRGFVYYLDKKKQEYEYERTAEGDVARTDT